MATILEKIDSPAQLKSLTYKELQQLASEIRTELVDRVARNGGHLASNLGVVELTIALHRIFDSPRDKIIWDVGHQSYAHKLLTGRRQRFQTLRQYGGLSGFTDRTESPHDAFGAGHASTAISAALGMAVARDLAGDDYQVIAVVGDGALGGGMSFEALNHAGQLGTKLIVVLNDNGMAISPSVGALSKSLNLVRLDMRYEIAKAETKKAVTRLPLGHMVWGFSKRVKGRVMRTLIPDGFWADLGFVCLGPVDGHDLKELEAALIRARDYEVRPCLIHVLTQKGKGYPPAEADAVKFHGVSAIEPNGSNAPSYSAVFGQTVIHLMEENDKVVAITAAMLDGTGLTAAASRFPKRVFDVGLCEQHAVTLAAGLASQGFVPIVAIYSTFLQRAYDQIIHDVCLPNLPVVFAIDRAGVVGDDGKTHQGAFDVSYLRSIPNMIVAAPRDEDELRHLLFTATRVGSPMAVRYPRGKAQGLAPQRDLREIPIGQGEKLRDGKQAAILTLGPAAYAALSAAECLAEEGIECAVADARFAKPLDANLILNLAKEIRRLLVVEENTLEGGFGNAVLQLLASNGLTDVCVRSLGLPDRFIAHGPPDLLRSLFGISPEGIAKEIRLSFPSLRRQKPVRVVRKVE